MLALISRDKELAALAVLALTTGIGCAISTWSMLCVS
jgi:hypothetical protein